ncbi:YjzD family protein [Calidifontibacillus erzurumensis]|uniref:YjzD family protein n=1 Tax=Calidifontibacillus erzurumensis TaxID=2741433 RepID=A0A8J8GGQ5_9BACI|nr:YjzD family protein [Calidifontibacillus erzurumensis]NSL51478.1 YjzD family protein [Calidifontibacillus erzurumensis]
MRILWTVFWTFLLSQMLVYVVSSMTGSTYDFMQGVFLTAVFSIIIIFLGEAGVPNEPHESHH